MGRLAVVSKYTVKKPWSQNCLYVPSYRSYGISWEKVSLLPTILTAFIISRCRSNPSVCVCVWGCGCVYAHVWIGDKALDGYSKKKYVCKLLFIFLLGHDIDFGHMEAVNLLSSNKYTEKQIVSLSSRSSSRELFTLISLCEYD